MAKHNIYYEKKICVCCYFVQLLPLFRGMTLYHTPNYGNWFKPFCNNLNRNETFNHFNLYLEKIALHIAQEKIKFYYIK